MAQKLTQGLDYLFFIRLVVLLHVAVPLVMALKGNAMAILWHNDLWEVLVDKTTGKKFDPGRD